MALSTDELEELRLVEGLSIARLCRLLGIPGSRYYRMKGSKEAEVQKRQTGKMHEKTLDLAKKHPYYGYRKIWALLGKERHQVSQSTVYRHLKREGLLLSPRYQLEVRRKQKAARMKYLKKPCKPNELWQVDITWVDLGAYGFYYVVNVVDYFSRFPLASHLSATHTTEDVIRGLQKAMAEAKRLRGELPSEITLVSGNGPQFTSARFFKWVQESPFRHVRARSHHPQTTGMVERYHQSLRYEEVWLNEYQDPIEASQRINDYRLHYSYARPHQALDYGVPAHLYVLEKSGDPVRKTA
jgi:putative transposase